MSGHNNKTSSDRQILQVKSRGMSLAMLKTPLDFVNDIENGKHIVLFFEEAEYARMIAFKYLEKGLHNRQQCFYITTQKEEPRFIIQELKESIVKDKGVYENNGYIDNAIKNNIINIKSIPDLFGYDGGLDKAIKDILNIVKTPTISKMPYLQVIDNIGKSDNHNNENAKRTVLRCVHKIETEGQIMTNLKWEKEYRNTILRKELPDSSIICTYPINNIISTIKGQSNKYSEWMSKLLEMYDAVIYANNYWKGAAFNLE